MTTMSLPAELVWTKARLTRHLADGSDTIRHRRVRLVLQGDLVRIYESDGSLTLEAKWVEGNQPTSRSLELVTENGEQWTAEPMGCNCGGE